MVTCDVAPLDCADLLLGIPYQEARNSIYHAKNHQYQLQLDGRTYFFIATKQPPHPSTNPKNSLNQCISLCLVQQVQADHVTNPTPTTSQPLIAESVDVSTKPTDLPLSRPIKHTIDIILRNHIPTASDYHLAP